MAEKSRVIVMGAGGNCVDIVEIIHDVNDSLRKPAYECVGFLDDDESRWGSEVAGVPVLGPLRAASEYEDHLFVNGIGSPYTFRKKADIIARTGIPDARFPTLVHPSASVSRSATLGLGTVIFQNVTVNSNARLGKHVIVLANSVISHDVTIGDYSSVTGGVCISGGTHVGRSCYLGTNSSIIGSIRVGDGSLVGMGSVVLKNVPEGCVIAGNPARILRHSRARGA